MAAEIDRLLEREILELATAELASRTVFAPKKGGLLWFFINYRKLDSVKICDSYPFPITDECIDSLDDACIFTNVDVSSGYWQIRIDLRHHEKTIFKSHRGLYQIVRMPLSVVNAPSISQMVWDVISLLVKLQSTLSYVFSTVLFSKTVQGHQVHLQRVLTLLQNGGVGLQLKNPSSQRQ